MSDFVFAAFADEAGAALSEQIDAMRENRVPFLDVSFDTPHKLVDILGLFFHPLEVQPRSCTYS